MNIGENTLLPPLFRQLTELGCLSEHCIHPAGDGFFAVSASLAEILSARNILSLPGEQGREMECRLFFDDWYLYAVEAGEQHTVSLFKMREQEYDRRQGLFADGDIPGVTVSFIAMDAAALTGCLTEPTEENRRRLNREIDRVVARSGQTHHPALKAYFLRTESRGAYTIARLYTDGIAALAENGELPVPECYAALYQKEGTAGRLPAFLEENNRTAGTVICDHRRLYLGAGIPDEPRRLAILATHTGNTSPFSFAAEVQYHARFLVPWARIPIPFLGRSAYASAVRADMSIGDSEFTGPTPYYRPDSRLVRDQLRCHKGREWT